jgi:outer membrane receptor protein involved in Fe transport
MMKRVLVLFYAMIVLFTMNGYSRKTLTGRVAEIGAGTPVANATLTVSGTGIATVTGPDGGFRLTVPENDGLVRITVTCSGYESTTVKIKTTGKPGTIFLTPTYGYHREEVLVEGYAVDEAVEAVVSQEAVAGVGSTQTADALLANLAGIDVKRTSPGGDKGSGVTIRGFDESRSLILLNGRPLNGSGVMGGHYVDWSSLSTEDVERIEVIRGAKTAEYGNTLGGVINIVTKRTGLKPRTSLRTSYGSYGTLNLALTHQGRLSDKLSYSLSAGNWKSDGFLRNNDVNRTNIAGNLIFTMPAGITVEAGGRYTRHRRGFVVVNEEGMPYYDPDFPDSLSSAGGGPGIQFISGDYSWGDDSYWINIRQQYDVVIKKRFGNIDLRASAYINDQDRTEYYFAANDNKKQILERFAKPEDMTWGWDLKAVGRTKNHRYKLGLEGVHLRYGGGEIRQIDLDYFKKEPEMELETIEAVTRHSVFVQDSWGVTDKLNLNLGVRYDNYKGRERPGTGIPETNREGWSPRLNLVYRPWKGAQVEVSAARALRFPTCPEYYWYFGGFQPAGRKPLAPEDALQLEFGLSLEFGNTTRLNARGYFYKVENYLRTIFGYRPSRVVYNVDKATLWGAEMEFQHRIMKNLAFSCNYTYQSTEKKGDVLDMSSELTSELTELPKNKFNAALNFRTGRGFKLDLSLRHVGRRSVLMGNLAQLNASSLETMKAFTTVALSAVLPVFKREGFSGGIKIGCENIFNEAYVEKYGFPMPGRTLFAGIEMQL